MPHQRVRFAEKWVKKMASFWPIVGILGLRQVGKSTLLRDRLKIKNYLTLDNDDTKLEAQASPGTFLARNEFHPTVIDEVQKVPKLFDAIKAYVDRKRRPGQWYLSGSVAFSEKIGIRESLTGRIGLLHLYPMTLAEITEKEILRFGKTPFVQGEKCRFPSSAVAKQMTLGGLPVSAFLRDENVREQYWRSWVETSIFRDAGKVFGRGFDPERCDSLVRQLSQALDNGEYPSFAYVTDNKRVAKKYIRALESIFFLRRFTVHEKGTGLDHWMFGDSGLAYYLATKKHGEGLMLSMARHFVLNEIFSLYEYHGKSFPRCYFKSPRGAVIDLVIENTPIRIVHETISPSKTGWYERALKGAMQALNATRGILVAPVDYVHLTQRGISIVPWSYWS